MNWYLSNEGGEPLGPLEGELIERGILAGRVPPDSLVCPVGSKKWKPLDAVPAFAAALRKVAPPPQPPTPDPGVVPAAREAPTTRTRASQLDTTVVVGKPRTAGLGPADPRTEPAPSRTSVFVALAVGLTLAVAIPSAAIWYARNESRKAAEHAAYCSDLGKGIDKAVSSDRFTDARSLLERVQTECRDLAAANAPDTASTEKRIAAAEQSASARQAAAQEAARKAAQDQAVKDRFAVEKKQIQEQIDRARSQTASGRPDQAAESLDAAAGPLNQFKDTVVDKSGDVGLIRAMLDAERARIQPQLDAYLELHPTVEYLVAKCETQRDALRSVNAEFAQAQSRGNVPAMQSLANKAQIAAQQWSSTRNRLSAADPGKVKAHCSLE